MTAHSFRSSLASDLCAFLRFKRALGSPYKRAEFTLRQLDEVAVRLDRHGGRHHLESIVSTWLSERTASKPVSITVELAAVRQFCQYLRRRDPRSFVPGREWAPQSTKSDFTPHIFSREEVRRLLTLAVERDLPSLHGKTLRVLMLILYCTGLRFGEAVRLRIGDVDMKKRTFFIQESKGRSRHVPFDVTLARELRRYLRARRTFARADLHDRFFLRADGRLLSVRTASDAMRTLFRRAGFKPSRGRIGPRPYDMRHTFAVHRLTRWYRARVDLHARLPLLSAYMGHDNILGTEAYLTATPELLALAASRFRRRLEH
jgi:integrase